MTLPGIDSCDWPGGVFYLGGTIIDGSRKQRLITLKGIFEDFMSALSTNVKNCQSVCLTLGPYRNLTTLTAATLFLHPHCQVLNHAGDRVLGSNQFCFLSDYSQKKFTDFCRYAIRISAGGKRGNYGGSVTFSHAFDSKYEMKDVFLKTGGRLVKKEIRCLFWKESLRTTNLIRRKNVDLENIFRHNKLLRFLSPIRNPLDCAISNMKTGKVDLFESLDRNASKYEVVQAILEEILWFAKLQKKNPARFFSFFENEISHKMLVRLANFLQLDPFKFWLQDAVSVMKNNSRYHHDDEFIDCYRQYVNEMFVSFPSISAGLLRFADERGKNR